MSEKINYGSMVDAETKYPVTYTIKQDGTKVYSLVLYIKHMSRVSIWSAIYNFFRNRQKINDDKKSFCKKIQEAERERISRLTKSQPLSPMSALTGGLLKQFHFDAYLHILHFQQIKLLQRQWLGVYVVWLCTYIQCKNKFNQPHYLYTLLQVCKIYGYGRQKQNY